jgi:hypothetical protein
MFDMVPRWWGKDDMGVKMLSENMYNGMNLV